MSLVGDNENMPILPPPKAAPRLRALQLHGTSAWLLDAADEASKHPDGRVSVEELDAYLSENPDSEYKDDQVLKEAYGYAGRSDFKRVTDFVKAVVLEPLYALTERIAN